jgi:hypothetical protein
MPVAHTVLFNLNFIIIIDDDNNNLVSLQLTDHFPSSSTNAATVNCQHQPIAAINSHNQVDKRSSAP